MPIYYPALISSAIFFAAIVVNLREKENTIALFLSLIAIPIILFLGYLSQKNLDILAYIIILIPIIVLYTGYSIGIKPSNIVYITLPNHKNASANKNDKKVMEKFTQIVPDRIESEQYA
jgi:uncharacterized protein YacL